MNNNVKDLNVFLVYDYCVSPDTKILGSDLLWRPAGDLKPRDQVIGFDEFPEWGQGKRRNMHSTPVQKVTVLKQPCLRIVTTAGDLVCSTQHRWLTRCATKTNSTIGKLQWVKSEDLQIGNAIAYFGQPWKEEEGYDSGYLAGFFDGEGWVSKHFLGFGQNKGNVLDYVKKLLKTRGFEIDYREYEGRVVSGRFSGGVCNSLRFLGQHRPLRLLEKAIPKLIEGFGVAGRYRQSQEILAIEKIGTRTVIGLQTRTKTYIANGFLSHNSQIEIRELAEISGDKLLISQFASGADIHCQVGRELTGWPIERIAKDQNTRRIVKGFHFSLVYGTSEDGMVGRMHAEGLKVTKKLIHSFFVRYFKKYKGVAKFMQDSINMADILGYVETMFGFRRYIRKEDEDRKTYWANQAINSRVQGSAHTLVLVALALLSIKPKTYHLLQDPIMEVHDALYWRVRLRDLQEAYRQGKELLEHGVILYVLREFKRKLLVPLVAESKAGFCLGSMVDYHGEPVSEFLPKWRAKHIEVEKTSWEKLLHED